MSEPTTFDEALDAIVEECTVLMKGKRLDYGTAGILNTPFGVEKALVTRCYDKLSRIVHLLTTEEAPRNESMEDSWRDLANYALIALLVRRRWFDLPVQGR